MFKTSFDKFACVHDSIKCQVDGFTIRASIQMDECSHIDDDSHNIDQNVTGCNDEQQV